MGALRLGKLAKYLLSKEHDVRVVCGRDLPRHQTLPVEVAPDRMFTTPWRHANSMVETATQFRCSVAQLIKSLSRRQPEVTRAIAAVGDPAPDETDDAANVPALRALAIDLTSFPDERVAWLPHAFRGARDALDGWRPDVVLASAPPFSVLAVGAGLARSLGVPWVAEYRDRWAEDPYREISAWRRPLEHRLEDALVADASGIVTVSEPWAADYRERWGKPTIVVYNGFDPEDFPLDYAPAEDDPDHLNIVYTGILYPGRRDPTPLFQALASMNAAADGVRVRFYGSDPEIVRDLAASHGVERLVEAFGRVPYEESSACSSRQTCCCSCSGTIRKSKAIAQESFSNILPCADRCWHSVWKTVYRHRSSATGVPAKSSTSHRPLFGVSRPGSRRKS